MGHWDSPDHRDLRGPLLRLSKPNRPHPAARHLSAGVAARFRFSAKYHWCEDAGDDPLNSCLFCLCVMVMVSGFGGIAMQHFFPGIMKDRITREWVYEQIPNVREANFEAVLDYKKSLEARLKSEGGGGGGTEGAADPAIRVVVDFLSNDVLPFLSNRSARRTRLADARNADDVFRLVRLNVS